MTPAPITNKKKIKNKWKGKSRRKRLQKYTHNISGGNDRTMKAKANTTLNWMVLGNIITRSGINTMCGSSAGDGMSWATTASTIQSWAIGNWPAALLVLLEIICKQKIERKVKLTAGELLSSSSNTLQVISKATSVDSALAALFATLEFRLLLLTVGLFCVLTYTMRMLFGCYAVRLQYSFF